MPRGTTFLSSRVLVVVALLGASACGARSALPIDAQDGRAGTSAGGAGGATLGGGGSGAAPGGGFGGIPSGGFGGVPSGGSGGTLVDGGGTGGKSNDCPSLVPLDPILEVEQAPGDDDRLPALTYTSSDHQQVAVAFAPVPALENLKLGVSLVSPWGAWPTDPALNATRYENLGQPLGLSVVVPKCWAGESFDGKIAVGVEASPPIVFSTFSCREFDPNWSTSTLDQGSCTPIGGDFVAKGPPSQHLLGWFYDSWIKARVVGTPLPLMTEVAMGCVPSGIVADAVGYEDGWLVAHSNSPGITLVDCTFKDPGPPTDIDIEKVISGTTVSLLLAIHETTPITTIRTVAHPSGLYVVYRMASGGTVAPLRFARVDVSTMTVIGPTDLTGPGDVPLDNFDVASVGNRLAVAWGNDSDDNPPDIVVSVAGEDGTVLGRGTLLDRFTGRVSAVGSPAGGSVAVSWEEPTSSGANQVRLARFDCVPQP